jgi:hypothetical protein
VFLGFRQPAVLNQGALVVEGQNQIVLEGGDGNGAIGNGNSWIQDPVFAITGVPGVTVTVIDEFYG